jgi:transcriptional regulator with XRE-family HTH domain
VTTLHVGAGHLKDNRVLGELLRGVRTQHRFSGAEVARAVGFSRTMLYGIERGREAPSTDSLTRLLTVLGEEHRTTELDAVVWGDYTITCSRYSGNRLTGPPDRPLAPAPTAVDHGYIQILDWR